MRRALVRLLSIAVIGYLAILAVLWASQDNLIHPGWAGPSPQAVATIPGLEEIAVRGADGLTLRGWARTAAPGAPTLILFHGNGGAQWRKLSAFVARGWGILLVSYRGYAGNPGKPSEAGLMADARAVLAYAAQELGVPPSDTILYGESLGTGVAARMALEPGAWRAVVLDAPYTSVEDRAAEVYRWVPVRLLLRDRFATKDHIAGITAPLLILHGTQDRTIPVSHGQALATLAPDAKGVWIDGAGHALPPDRVVAELTAFLAATE